MSNIQNCFNQPVGLPIADWQPRPLPERLIMEGRFCRLEPLNVDQHAADLWQAWSTADDQRGWTYLSCGPFNNKADYGAYLQTAASSPDPMHYAVINLDSNQAEGTIALMRIDAPNGAIEVGFVVFSPLLQRTVQATEAHYLLMKYAFETLGYRRYEWKCDSLNAPSRRAAQRLGFTFEGQFRQAGVYKGRTRDTAWFSIIDSEWPQVKDAFEAWLAPKNLQQGVQQKSLAALREERGQQ